MGPLDYEGRGTTTRGRRRISRLNHSMAVLDFEVADLKSDSSS